MLEAISVGLLIAVLWGAVGYAVAKAKADEEFEPAKFGKTLVLGIILAAFAEGLGIPIAEIEGMTFVGFLTVVVDKVSSLFFKPPK